MIDKIGVNHLSQVRFSKNEDIKPAFKSKEELPQIENLKGAEILATYSAAFISNAAKKDLDLKTVPLINPETSIDNIEGERIYTSDGKLDSIVVEDENTKTIYYPDSEKADFIERVNVFDKEAKKFVFEQQNFNEPAGLSQYVYKYSKDGEKKIIECSAYEDGKFTHSWKDSIGADGLENLSQWNDNYTLTLDNRQGYSRMEFDKDGLLSEISTTKNLPNGEFRKEVAFADGELYRATKEKTVYFNKFDTSAFEDEKFKPADKFPFTMLPGEDLNAYELDGERTYYSNGAIESVMTNLGGVDTKVTFSPLGIVKAIEAGNKELSYDNSRNQIIAEHLGENETKETIYYRDSNHVRVIHNLDGDKKSVSYDNGIIDYYYEENANGDRVSWCLNEEGYVIHKDSFNTKGF